MEQSLSFTASDGTVLEASVAGYGSLQPRPLIVEDSPYAPDPSTLSWAGQDFNFVELQWRGTGASGGSLDAGGALDQSDLSQFLAPCPPRSAPRRLLQPQLRTSVDRARNAAATEPAALRMPRHYVREVAGHQTATDRRDQLPAARLYVPQRACRARSGAHEVPREPHCSRNVTFRRRPRAAPWAIGTAQAAGYHAQRGVRLVSGNEQEGGPDHMSPKGSRNHINVMVVDDSELVAQSLERILRGEPDIDVVGVAHSEEEAIAVATAHDLDVVVMDYRLGDADGITAADHIRGLRPGVRTLILTGDIADSYMLSRARAAGCAAVLAKTSGIHGSLAGTVRDAHAGTLHLSDPSQGVQTSL